MSFMAIVHAPALRSGARICICDLDQTIDEPPSELVIGSEVALRFGTCCPSLASGAIQACDLGADEAVLRIADADWTIRRSHEGGVNVAGLVAEDWFVVGR